MAKIIVKTGAVQQVQFPGDGRPPVVVSMQGGTGGGSGNAVVDQLQQQVAALPKTKVLTLTGAVDGAILTHGLIAASGWTESSTYLEVEVRDTDGQLLDLVTTSRNDANSVRLNTYMPVTGKILFKLYLTT